MKRLTFILFKHNVVLNKYELVLNPEEYTLVEPARVNVTQTSGGAFVDDFGLGIPILYFRGQTGFKNRDNDVTSGLKNFKNLRDDIYRAYFKNQAPGEQSDYELHLYNYIDEDYLIIVPQIFTLQRSISQPLLFRYEARFMVLRYLDAKSAIADDLPAQFTLPNYTTLMNQFLSTYTTAFQQTPISF